MTVPLRVWLEHDARLLRLRLARSQASTVDGATIAALDAALAGYLQRPDLLAVLIDAQGQHFSFDACVEEHLPASCGAMLASLHGLLLRLLASPVPVLFAVRGHCMGGGLALALAGTLVFASPDAQFGQPEIRMGVFAPASACLLPERLPRAVAEDMLLSGRSLSAAEACARGLVTEVSPDPVVAAVGWFNRHLADKSGAALRHALRAARLDYVDRIGARMSRLERLYLDELMATHDAHEGLTAFLARRPPAWEHR